MFDTTVTSPKQAVEDIRAPITGQEQLLLTVHGVIRSSWLINLWRGYEETWVSFNYEVAHTEKPTKEVLIAYMQMWMQQQDEQAKHDLNFNFALADLFTQLVS